ncbi:MAG: two component transcriptional regulator, Fis family [Myxococcales bacterium]|nr:two component transcriptional regulator, Fis family [Myxococcales bacterium]
MVRGGARPAVLLVDDDPTFLNTFAREFARRDWNVATAGSPAAAAAEVRRQHPSVIVLDLMLGDDNGLDLIEALHAESPDTRIVMTTGHPTLATAVEAMRRGAHYYLPKPCNVDRLIAAAESEPAAPPPVSRRASLAQSERAHINRVIAACDGNISEAARRLGMHRRSLQRKLRKHVPGGS